MGPISFVARGGVHVGLLAEDFQRLLLHITGLAVEGKLHHKQAHLAAGAFRMVRALVGVGLVALIDEATGYQKERPDDALAKLFKQYLLDECGEWTLEFREPFYTQLARVYRHAYEPGQGTRPAFFRGLTWRYVYGVLPPEVRAEIQVRNPNPHEGAVRHHQHLTPAAKAIVRGHILRLTTVLRQSR
ncbi:MAG: P63C domain-containing protein, partial [Schumannella sp.]